MISDYNYLNVLTFQHLVQENVINIQFFIAAIMPTCSGCRKPINGGKWCRVCFVSEHQSPQKPPLLDTSADITTLDFNNSDESRSSLSAQDESSGEENYRRNGQKESMSSEGEDSLPEGNVCGDVDRRERDFIELVKDNMLKHQQQQAEHIKRLEDHLKYLRNDVMFLKSDIENKNMVIKFLLSKLRSKNNECNGSDDSSFDDNEDEESLEYSHNTPTANVVEEQKQCVDEWRVSTIKETSSSQSSKAALVIE